MKPFLPAYFNLSASEIEARANQAYKHLEACDVCARDCRVNRLGANGLGGLCKTAFRPRVNSYGPDLGEETPISGAKGSGMILFGRLPMKFRFYQPYEVNETDEGYDMEPEEIAAAMLEMQDLGCHNINLVAPSHVVPQILLALRVALKAGLNLPLVYNSDGYDSIPMLQLLDTIVDIYVPDMRFTDDSMAERYLRVTHYTRTNRAVVKEMHRQVGDLLLDDSGVAKHGLLVRHLVLPRHLAGTEHVARFLVDEISANTYIHVMRRFFPSQGRTFPEINRPLTDAEFDVAVRWVERAGLRRVDTGPIPQRVTTER